MKRWVATVLALAGAVGISTPAQAVTQQAAVAAATAGVDVSRSAVWATPAPLPPGSRVVEAGPGAWIVGKPRREGRSVLFRLRPWRTRAAAWLVWLDQAPGAGFAHPGRLALVDDATGRVTARRPTLWWPRVDGRDPPGLGASRQRFAFAQVGGAAQLRAKGLPAAAAQLDEPSLPPLPHDCMVVIGDRIDQGFPADALAAMRPLAERLNIPYRDATSVADLRRKVTESVHEGCSDVMLAVIGHGYPPKGLYPWWAQSLPETIVGTEAGAVRLRWRQQSGKGDVTERDETLRYEDLAGVVADAQRSNTKFKIVIHSCYSGRFVPLANKKGVAVVATSSGPFELSWSRMSPDLPAGTKVVDGKLVLGPKGGPTVGGFPDAAGGIIGPLASGIAGALVDSAGDLASAVFRAAGNSAGSVAARLGITHPRVRMGVSGKLVTAPPKPPCTPINVEIRLCDPPPGKLLLDISLSFNPAGGSTVTVQPLGVTVTDPASLPHTTNPAFGNVLDFVSPGTQVTMTAKPGGGYYFDGWQSVAGLGENCQPPIGSEDGAFTCGPVTVTDGSAGLPPGYPTSWLFAMSGGALFEKCPPNAAKATTGPIARDCH